MVDIPNGDIPIKIGEVNLHSAQVLPLRLVRQEKDKKVVGSDKLIEPSLNVSLLEASTSVPTHMGYNILVHLRKLPTRLSIYDTLILSKKIRDLLVKLVHGLKIGLD